LEGQGRCKNFSSFAGGQRKKDLAGGNTMNAVQFTLEILERLQDAIERALQAFEELEKAIDSGDNRKIGACLYELRQALKEADREAHEANSR